MLRCMDIYGIFQDVFIIVTIVHEVCVGVIHHDPCTGEVARKKGRAYSPSSHLFQLGPVRSFFSLSNTGHGSRDGHGGLGKSMKFQHFEDKNHWVVRN